MSQQQPVHPPPASTAHQQAPAAKIEIPVLLGLCLLLISCFALYRIFLWLFRKGRLWWHGVIHYFAKKDRQWDDEEEEEDESEEEEEIPRRKKKSIKKARRRKPRKSRKSQYDDDSSE